MDLFTVSRPADPAVTALRACVALLPERDQSFARSLLDAAARGRLSEKQAAWVGKLTAQAKAPAPITTDGLGNVLAILRAAGHRLKFPVLRFEAEGTRYRLGLTGPQSRQPGTVVVTTDEKAFEDRTYLGRIDDGGRFEPSHKVGDTATAIGLALRAFAADPAEQARIYGQRYGRCCFCGLELTDGRSVDAGYGPICAEKWGMPWG
jgi:hypothetical protein